MNEDVNQLISGFMVAAYWGAGLFFTRFWRESRDRLFIIFASAFWLLGIQRLALSLTTEVNENVTYLYVVRLIAFVLILWGIIDKNRARKRSGAG